MSEGWSLTESDPAIFTALLSELGVKGLEVSELYSLDASLLSSLQPIYALIFLFKYVDPAESPASSDPSATGTPKEDTDFYFAHQVINNACATMAILNAALNIQGGPAEAGQDVDLGPDLTTLKEFSLALDPSSRGWAVSNSEKIREAHNSFARSDPFEHSRDPDDEREKEDAYHFITYIPIEGELYELDGLKRTPVSHGKLHKDAPWTDAAKAVIERRIASYGGSEINFNLMAICADQVRLLQKQIEAAQAIQGSAAGGDTNTGLAESTQHDLYRLQVRLQDELAKRERWAFENTLRRHNHLGLVHALLVAMAKEGKLTEAIEESRKVMKERQEKAAERAKMAGQA
ncbi:ubiquitin carboxyl-terminal hydrolase isozyme L5 [Cystobasidium minutum MCA 4210]|uniref:ubiquitin carboxyl-terminal hydrolase isozyme L5 n=1 Tax=Cystobasidium minutum MCA 4210 TaxID=1397322 RepID=UPI0034CDBF54|eukprot:jgi/Rhomi1/157100/estExt_Genewise1Plus.C_1_t20307